MKTKGLHTHRFKDNPEEKRFAEAWEATCKQGSTLAYLLHVGDQGGARPPEPSERDHEVAATIIQWLGSPVGQSWLSELGYKKIDEVHDLIEKAAKGHDDLAKKHPSGPDRMKAETLRRFADVFLPSRKR